jgi:hypothetical protein
MVERFSSGDVLDRTQVERSSTIGLAAVVVDNPEWLALQVFQYQFSFVIFYTHL